MSTQRRGIRNAVILLCIILVTSFFITVKVSARAGGGYGGGHSSGGSSYSHGTSTGRSNPMTTIVLLIAFGMITGAGTFFYLYNVKRANLKSRHAISKFRKNGHNWEYEEIQKRVEKAYFEIQECWKREDPDYAAEYLSASLLNEFKMKIEWMHVNNEQVVQEKVKLLEAVIVSVEDYEGTKLDRIWYLIHGKMIGYYKDKDTGKCVRGTTSNEAFYEYWCFIYENGHWVLNKIKQKEEVNIDELKDEK
ncbi:MAG: Tim44-like domain-containing protein [bacterium]|nr:Tim44-like domain-containing protein [bacterium]